MDWQAIGVILTGIGLIGTILGFFFKNLIERRFEALETSLKNQASTIQEQQLAFQKWQAETPGLYMRREECARCKEDSVYLKSTMDAKMDIILRRIRNLRRLVNNGKKSEQ